MTALLLAAAVATSLLFTGCGEDEADDIVTAEVSEDAGLEEVDESPEEKETGIVEHVISEEARTGEGSVAFFIGEPFYEGTINDVDDALEAVHELLDYIGGYENVTLEPVSTVSTDEGNIFYTFRQLTDDAEVYAASLKLVTDKDGVALGLNSTLIPGLSVSGDVKWSIDADEAEAIVKETLKEEGVTAKIIPGVTEQTLLPWDDAPSAYHYVWVVYTSNYYDDVCTAYLAHYVNSEGEYLYCNPVSSPSNTDALSGAAAAFTFENLEADTWTGTVTKHQGDTEEITVPVARDPETGDVYLADVERRIILADYAAYTYDDTFEFRKEENGRFNDNEVLTYRTFIDVYDFYAETGWHGCDDNRTPILLLMDWVDEDGKPVDNACYSGRAGGFDVFQFSHAEPSGETYDLIGHEFTHAVTASHMINNFYRNDYGAIDEALSDIKGNLIESMLGKTTDKTWLIGENGNEVLRSMSHPNEYRQPGFVWDRYYVPAVSRSGVNNDCGGVHSNSSLLNLIAYRLNESGMDEADQFYFWTNVSLMLTSRTDYEQIAEVLPWALKLVGHDEYMDVLSSAIAETGIEDNTLPDDAPEGLARFEMVFPDHDVAEGYDIYAYIRNIEKNDVFRTWLQDETDLMAATVDPGDYTFEINICDEDSNEEVILMKSTEGWDVYTGEDMNEMQPSEDNIISVKKGDIIKFDPQELQMYLQD